MTTDTLGVEDGCVFRDTGFFNRGFDDLVRDTLTLPVTRFNKYQIGGVFGFPPSGNHFGFDLSTAEVAATYIDIYKVGFQSNAERSAYLCLCQFLHFKG